MYTIQYSNGRKICDGYAPSVESALKAAFDKNLTYEGSLGDEVKYSNAMTGHVMYIRPNK